MTVAVVNGMWKFGPAPKNGPVNRIGTEKPRTRPGLKKMGNQGPTQTRSKKTKKTGLTLSGTNYFQYLGLVQDFLFCWSDLQNFKNHGPDRPRTNKISKIGPWILGHHDRLTNRRAHNANFAPVKWFHFDEMNSVKTQNAIKLGHSKQLTFIYLTRKALPL